jgi:hypothetical protein
MITSSFLIDLILITTNLYEKHQSLELRHAKNKMLEKGGVFRRARF